MAGKGKPKHKGRDRARKKKAARAPKYTAASADKYELYQLAVQSPEPDIDFLRRVYKKENGRTARNFREDFSGTGLLTAKWIRKGPKYTAEAFDIDPEPVEWGRRHHFDELGEAANQAVLHLKD